MIVLRSPVGGSGTLVQIPECALLPQHPQRGLPAYPGQPAAGRVSPGGLRNLGGRAGWKR